MPDKPDTYAASTAAGRSDPPVDKWMDYAIDLQRIIEDICRGDRTIREPVTTARYHYDMAVKYTARLDPVSSAAAGKSREREYPAEAENVAYEQGRADESMARADMHRECAQVLEMVSNRLRSLPPPSVEEGGEPEGTAPYTIEHANERGWTEAFMSRRGYVLDDLTGMWLPAITVLSRVRSELTALRKEGEAVAWRRALKEIHGRTYSSDRGCALKEDAVAEICDIATAALAHPSPAVPEGWRDDMLDKYHDRIPPEKIIAELRSRIVALQDEILDLRSKLDRAMLSSSPPYKG